MTKLLVLATENAQAGPLHGPFTFGLEAADFGFDISEAQFLAIVIGFVRTVAAGVSCYNKQAMEESSNLKSYAVECFEDLKAEAPESAAHLENLTVDCSRLPKTVRGHPIWKLDRAILRTLPGAAFID